MPDWLSDASANRHIKTYVKDFLDLSGNLTVRNAEDYKWNSYGQVLSGNYESDAQVYFGIAADMDASGNTIIVGANKDGTAGTAGAAYVYKYDSDADIWYQHGPTLTPNTSLHSNFGWQGVFISDDGSIVAVNDYASAPTTGSNTYVGKVYVFQYNSSTKQWDDYGSNQSILEGTATSEKLGVPGISMSGDGSTIAAVEQSGDYSVRIFKLVSGSWAQIGTFSTSSVSYTRPNLNYDGSRVVFNDFTNQQALVYDYSGSTTWNQVGSTITNTGGNSTDSHTSINKEGNIIAVHEQTNQTVKTYQYDATVTGSWKQLGTTLMNSYGSSGRFGEKMRLNADGDMIIIGDFGYSTIQTYKYQNGDWSLVGSIIQGTGAYGRAVAISDDGTKIVAGGYSTALNGNGSGYVQAWQWSQKSYGQLIDISGETVIFGKDMHKDDPNYYKVVQDGMDASVYFVNNELYGLDATDYFGGSLAMNEDGTIMIVGSPLADVESSRVGVGIVYRWQNERWGQMGQNISPTTSYESFSAATLDMNDAGDKVVIGSQENLTGGASGLLTSYEFINGDWVQRGSALTSSNGSGRFGGEGCAMDGTGNIIAGMDVVGSVKVYQYVEGNGDWSQLGSDISVTSGRANSAFHLSSDAKRRISLNQDGTIIAVGDVFDSTTGTSDGRLSVYKFTGNVTDGSWNLIGNHITVTPTTLSENLGREVSINNDGTIVAATALFYNNNEGRTFIYKYSEDAGDWVQLGTDIGANRLPDSDVNYTANSVSLSGDGKTVAIGHGYADAMGQNTGAINVLKYANGDWVWVGALYGSQIDSYLKRACISGDGKRIAGGSTGDDSTGADAGMVITGSIINNLDGAAMKIEHDRVHIPKLEAGNGWTTTTSLTKGILSMPMMTLTGLSSYERDFRKEWGLDANTEGFNRDRWAFTHDTGHKHASYFYLDDSGQTILDLLFRGFERVDETNDYFYRSGYALVSRYLGDAMFFQTSSTEENQNVPNKRFSLGIGQPPGWYTLNVVGNAYAATAWDGSDDRLKHNEILITNGLETIRKLAPRHYFKTRKMYDADHNFDLDASGNPLDASGNALPATEYSIETGFIAQEVKEISELAHTFKKGQEDQPHGIQYSSIFVRAIKALQELDEKVQQRQAIITSLEEKIQTLENA